MLCELNPLLNFNTTTEVDLLDINLINAKDVTAPYDKLLVHKRDMTSTLKENYQDDILIRVLEERKGEEAYAREVVLVTKEAGLCVEYGAIEIYLNAVSEKVSAVILEGKIPLGEILNKHQVDYRSCPSQFFHLSADAKIASALGVDEATELFGRCNQLTRDSGEAIANIVEIVRP